MRTRTVLRSAAFAFAVLSGCEETSSEPEPVDPDVELRALLRIPSHMQSPYVPPENPVTAEKIELGRHLFYDVRLSANETQSCGGCHLQSLGFADGKKSPTGSTGDVLVRNSQGLANVAYNATYTWANDGLLTLESQIPIPIRNDDPTELGVSDGVVDDVLSRFEGDPDYQELFAAAYPEVTDGSVSMNMIVFALATFCRSMISGGSPYDRYLAGDTAALSESARRGLALFNGERLECFHCHRGVNLTVSYRDANTLLGSLTLPFFNNGLYDVDGEGSYPPSDQGLFDLTFDPDHRGLFRPPNLRNIALTAPYMHDGSIPTLEGVLEHYAAGGTLTEEGPNAGDGRTSPLKSGLVRGFQLSDEERAEVLAFLESLTDQSFVGDPAFSSPFDQEE